MNDISPRALIQGFTDLGGAYENVGLEISVNRNEASAVPQEFITRIYHCHPYYEFFYVKKEGMLLFSKENTAGISLLAGDVCIIPPFFEHYTQFDARHAPFVVGFSFYNNHVNTANDFYKALRTLLGTATAPTVIRACSFNRESLDAFLTDFNTNIAKNYLQSAFLAFCRILQLFTENAPTERRPLSKSDIISKVDNFISCFYMYDIKLTDLAECFYISEHSLNRLIYEYYHDTFHSLLTKRRMLIAATYLENTNEPVSAVAEKSGYVSSSNFYTAFKRHYGMLPSDYRKESKVKE